MQHYPLGYLLGTILKKQETLINEAIASLHISLKEYSVIMLLGMSKTQVTQLETGKLLKIDRTSIGRLIDGLSKKGYVRRKTNPQDRREYHLELTDQGNDLLVQLSKIEEECSHNCLSLINEEEQKIFFDCLKKIVEEENE